VAELTASQNASASSEWPVPKIVYFLLKPLIRHSKKLRPELIASQNTSASLEWPVPKFVYFLLQPLIRHSKKLRPELK